MKKNIEKSSRAKADFFELLICQGLINYFRLPRNYTEEIKTLRKTLSIFPDGKLRIKDQEEKAKRLLPHIGNLLKRKSKTQGQIKEILWIGRAFRANKTLADVKVIFGNNDSIGISLKSVGVGTGTQKNIGYKSVKECLQVDLDKELKNLWLKIRTTLKTMGGEYSKISELSQKAIKDSKYQYPKIQEFARKLAEPIQRKATRESVWHFNRLPLKDKINFLKILLGYDKKLELLTIIVSQKDILSYSNDKYDSLVTGKVKVEAKAIKSKSYGIFINGNLVLRVQSSFTNGVGLSPFCQRAFLTNI